MSELKELAESRLLKLKKSLVGIKTLESNAQLDVSFAERALVEFALGQSDIDSKGGRKKFQHLIKQCQKARMNYAKVSMKLNEIVAQAETLDGRLRMLDCIENIDGSVDMEMVKVVFNGVLHE